MRLAVTGTPGVGKTTATERLAADADFDLEVVHVNEVIESEPTLTVDRDEERDSMVVDIEALREHFGEAEDVLFESHLAHYIDTDRTVVLRCPPTTVEERLVERGEPRESAQENAESEALDIVLTEAVERAGRDAVYEIDTTDMEPSAVADAIREVVDGEREPSAGTVSFTGYL